MASQPSRLHILRPSASALALQGELDLLTADELQGALAALDPSEEAALDLSGIGFVDSSGLRVLVEAHQRWDAAGGRLVLDRPSSVVVKLLEITGLLHRMHIQPGDG